MRRKMGGDWSTGSFQGVPVADARRGAANIFSHLHISSASTPRVVCSLSLDLLPTTTYSKSVYPPRLGITQAPTLRLSRYSPSSPSMYDGVFLLSTVSAYVRPVLQTLRLLPHFAGIAYYYLLPSSAPLHNVPEAKQGCQNNGSTRVRTGDLP